ncbi:MAG: hypothetical protein KC656_01980 [Myxococcales bacterium]|nr:hypothetical protein [Myxococcales bacterium]MCB9691541.1 hypothetical protein [Alphaproteobacteria bacterium]
MRHLLVLGLVACGNPNYPPPAQLPAELVQCEQPSDCVVVELGCCDACNGGTAVSVRADRRDEVVDTYAETCGASTACTLIGCGALYATCVDSTCGMEREAID